MCIRDRYVGADYKDGENMETEVLVIDSNVDAWEDEAQAVRGITERELEARAIAGRIRELIHHHQVTDKKTGEFRLARYSDIVILTRSIKAVSYTHLRLILY